MAETAKLQFTVRQAAELMNVSERSIYMCAKVSRLRPDLAAKVEAGGMSISEAHRLATGRAKPTSWGRLVFIILSANRDD